MCEHAYMRIIQLCYPLYIDSKMVLSADNGKPYMFGIS